MEIVSEEKENEMDHDGREKEEVIGSQEKEEKRRKENRGGYRRNKRIRK